MTITPLDIIQKRFESSRKGYDPDAVTTFLEEVRETLEAVLTENRRLRDELTARDGEIADLRRTEDSIKETLHVARQVASQMQHNARQEADIILGDARLDGERILSVSQDEYRLLLEQIVRLKATRMQVVTRMRAMLASQLQVLADLEQAGDTDDAILKVDSAGADAK
jgi:cell division initiation protein